MDRLLTAALACALTLQPAFAQSRKTDAELEALIPDAAVDNPDAFASVQAPAQASTEPEVDPASPLADIAGFNLSWPDQSLDLPALVSLDPDPDLATAFAGIETLPELRTPQGDVAKISARLALAFPLDPAQFPERDEFQARFKSLSTLQSLGGSDCSQAAADLRLL
jgi:translocation and assembly module TamA